MKKRSIAAALSVSLASFGCGHTLSTKVGLVSIGQLQGRTLPVTLEGKVVQGEDCGYSYSLSNAVRDALKGTSYDTMVDVDVSNTTGVLVPSNCIQVKGTAIDSSRLPTEGEVP